MWVLTGVTGDVEKAGCRRYGGGRVRDMNPANLRKIRFRVQFLKAELPQAVGRDIFPGTSNSWNDSSHVHDWDRTSLILAVTAGC